ncbi:YfiT family bacillithiol transferase [Ochrovirga pacifica]|uniref:YfiT family bacillithiol transferase n=1 Tax=Ochrovirga pacifica TaxID=1042376 RepID=UPI0002558769|nr:putative metal-dependent hydrolase [Ochrovirga pacifica]
MEKLKFPIGPCPETKDPSNQEIQKWIQDIANFPKSVKEITQNLTVEELNWKYRPEGWTLKQVVHHCADSHLNSLIRFKLTLTENKPTIKPYLEDKWAELADALDDDVSTSIALLTALHKKWVFLLKSLSTEQLQMQFVHPEHGKQFSLLQIIEVYAWHCNHHLAHIKNAIISKGKYN